MSKQQLYINGVAVDMPTEDIKIKAESNIFGDVSKIKTAHSYSSVLPRSLTNDSVLGMAYVPSANTGGKTTHIYLKAALYLDGIPLFEDGSAVITKVDDKGYNINLFWGLLGVFDDIKEEGLKVNELPVSAHWDESTHGVYDWITLARNNADVSEPPPYPYPSGMDYEVFDRLDGDSQALALKYPWWMKAHNAYSLIGKIMTVYGVPYEVSQIASDRINNIIHRATTLKCIADGEVITMRDINVLTKLPNNKYYINWANNTSNVKPCYDARIGAIEYISEQYTYRWRAVRKIKCSKVRVWGYRTLDDWWVSFPSADNDKEVYPSYNDYTGRYEVDHTWYDVDLEGGAYLPMIGHHTDGVTSVPTVLRMEVEISEVDALEIGDRWSRIRNAPSIDIIKYLGEVLVHSGCVIVGSIVKPDLLRIVTLDEVAAAEPVPYDMQGVSTVTMSINDLAQRNVYKHKAYDPDKERGVEYDARGYINVGDTTLPLEKDAFTSEFIAPRKERVLHWDVEKNGNTYTAKWQDAPDNVVHYEIDVLSVRKVPHDFASIIDAFYTTYKRAVARPKVVEVTVRLSPLELLNFDMARPVHINQLNRNYLVESIASDNGDDYKLTLIQI